MLTKGFSPKTVATKPGTSFSPQAVETKAGTELSPGLSTVLGSPTTVGLVQHASDILGLVTIGILREPRAWYGAYSPRASRLRSASLSVWFLFLLMPIFSLYTIHSSIIFFSPLH